MEISKFETNMNPFIEKAGILIEALPYIQKLYGKTVVVKYGGNAMINENLKYAVAKDITLLKYIGMNPVLVHGGGPDITSALKSFKIESEFKNGLRVTDSETMKVAQMVLIGKTNKEIVSLLNTNGGKAIGISGIDGSLIKCKKMDKDADGNPIDIGFVGDIESVDAKILNHLLLDEYIPVIAPIGVDEFGQSYNINADTVASAVAKALKAEKLIFLTDTEGVKDKNGDIIFQMNKDEVLENIKSETITGGMIPKVMGCLDAIDAGVNRVHIIDGRMLHCILLEIFTDTGIGTMMTEL